LKVFISADGPVDPTRPTSHPNALGSQLGIWDFSFTKKLANQNELLVYYQHIFEDTSSHLDSINAIPTPVLLRGKPLTMGQFGQEVHPVIYPSGLVMLNPRWTSESYSEYYSKHYDEYYDVKRSSFVRSK